MMNVGEERRYPADPPVLLAKLENDRVFIDVGVGEFDSNIIDSIVDCRLEYWFDNNRVVEKLGIFENWYYAKIVVDCVCCEYCTRKTSNANRNDDSSDISATMSNLTVHKPESRVCVWYVFCLKRDIGSMGADRNAFGI